MRHKGGFANRISVRFSERSASDFGRVGRELNGVTTNASQTRESKRIQGLSNGPANNRFFGLAVHDCLPLALSPLFSSPSYFPSSSKQAKRRTELWFADSDPVQMLARLSRSTRQLISNLSLIKSLTFFRAIDIASNRRHLPGYEDGTGTFCR